MNDFIQQRLADYHCQSALDEENAIKEITQEIALYAFSATGFFEVAAFHGGTALRVLHGMRRFSEDLDFALVTPNRAFNFVHYLEAVVQAMAAYGYAIRVTGKDRVDSAVKMRFLKEDSIGSLVTFEHISSFRGSIAIKLEVDTHPPPGATYQLKYVDFPLDFPIQAFDLPSMFGSKIHALLCRPFVKGRDWFDFKWYVAKKVTPNFPLLSGAIDQLGPWQGKGVVVDPVWVLTQMRQRIVTIDWAQAARDVERFLTPEDLKTLSYWSTDFFLEKLEMMAAYLPDSRDPLGAKVQRVW